MIRLAKQYGRYGYRKVNELLRVEGVLINHKKVDGCSPKPGYAVRPRTLPFAYDWMMLGGLFAGALMWAVALAYRRWRGVDGLGFGDVKRLD